MPEKLTYSIDKSANQLMTRARVYKDFFVPRLVKVVDENIAPFYSYKRMLVRDARRAGYQVPEDLGSKDYYDVPIYTDKIIVQQRRLCLRKRRGSPSKTRILDIPIEMEYAARDPFFFIDENTKDLQRLILEDIKEWMNTDQEDNKFYPRILVLLGIRESPEKNIIYAREVFYIHEYHPYDKMIISNPQDDFYEIPITEELMRHGRIQTFVLFFPAVVSFIRL